MYRIDQKKSITAVVISFLVAIVITALFPKEISANGWPQEAYPCNTQDIPITNIAFTWTPHIKTLEYTFQLSENTEFTNLLAETNLSKSAYLYRSKLNYSTDYFWRVRVNKPLPMDWSAAYYFRTIDKPPVKTDIETPVQNSWVWIYFGITGPLIIVLTVLLYKR